jgi:hypothetical protein
MNEKIRITLKICAEDILRKFEIMFEMRDINLTIHTKTLMTLALI